jgi:Zn-dependent M28 family amino/carboxypeptidase
MRRIIVSCAIAALGAIAVLPLTGADGAAPAAKLKAAKIAPASSYGNVDAISQDELKTYMYFLAADQLEGRNLPSRGYDVAALYIASHLAEWGLKPGGSTAGTNGPLQPYFMPMELAARQIVPGESKASLTAPAAAGPQGGGAGRGGDAPTGPRTTNYEYGKDWSAGSGRAPENTIDISGNLVFAGNGYVINKSNTNPYQGLDVKGKIIVVAGLPAEVAAWQNAATGRGGRGGAAGPNPLGTACTDFLAPEQYAAKNGALGVVSVATFQQLTAAGGRAGRGASLNGPAFQPVKFQQAAACPAAPIITAGLDLTNALFQGEKQNGSQVFYAAGSNSKLDSFELNQAKKISLRVAVKSEANHAEDVVGIIEGGDPVLKNEFVVLSAHLDHIGLSAPRADGDGINNGADDDASGCVGLMAVARAFAQDAAKGIRPKRSIVFLWNGGEEKGLWGSQLYTQFPPVDLTKVVANLNLDMIGRTRNANSVDTDKTHVIVNPGELLLVGPNISSDDLGKLIDAVNANTQKMTFNHFYDVTAPDATHDNLGPQPNGQRIFYRSDHYNFAKMGVPVAFFTTGLHVDYHRPSDSPEKIDYTEMRQVSKLVGAIGWELATQAGRPKLNDKLPDQLLKDMKAARDAGWGTLTPVPPPLPGEPF